nr:hypothetical protein CFP56_79385 [Quercus suber]
MGIYDPVLDVGLDRERTLRSQVRGSSMRFLYRFLSTEVVTEEGEIDSILRSPHPHDGDPPDSVLPDLPGHLDPAIAPHFDRLVQPLDSFELD